MQAKRKEKLIARVKSDDRNSLLEVLRLIVKGPIRSMVKVRQDKLPRSKWSYYYFMSVNIINIPITST